MTLTTAAAALFFVGRLCVSLFCCCKGISLGAAVALTLADRYNRDVGFAYNRKEAKDHGEGGNLVGAALEVRYFTPYFFLIFRKFFGNTL